MELFVVLVNVVNDFESSVKAEKAFAEFGDANEYMNKRFNELAFQYGFAEKINDDENFDMHEISDEEMSAWVEGYYSDNHILVSIQSVEM